MKNLGIILLAFFPFGIFGQNAIKVTVSGMIFNANVDSVRILNLPSNYRIQITITYVLEMTTFTLF
jgi:hypothetical protein